MEPRKTKSVRVQSLRKNIVKNVSDDVFGGGKMRGGGINCTRNKSLVKYNYALSPNNNSVCTI